MNLVGKLGGLIDQLAASKKVSVGIPSLSGQLEVSKKTVQLFMGSPGTLEF